MFVYRRSFYQDALGTNIGGKALQKEDRFVQGSVRKYSERVAEALQEGRTGRPSSVRCGVVRGLRGLLGRQGVYKECGAKGFNEWSGAAGAYCCR